MMTATENPRLFTKDHGLAQTSFAFAPSVFDFAQAFFLILLKRIGLSSGGYKLGTALSGIRPYYAALWRFSIV